MSNRGCPVCGADRAGHLFHAKAQRGKKTRRDGFIASLLFAIADISKLMGLRPYFLLSLCAFA
jgi:hypothetical protein